MQCNAVQCLSAGTHRRWGMAGVGRGVAGYRAIVLRRVVVRVAVARVDGRGDGRQLGRGRGGGRAMELGVRRGVGMGMGMGMGAVVVVVVVMDGLVLVGVLQRQGDGRGRVMWWLWSACAKSSWCLRRRLGLGLVVGGLPLGPSHPSLARVAVHGRATSRPQRPSRIGGGQ
jgi:hypothetical protein